MQLQSLEFQFCLGFLGVVMILQVLQQLFVKLLLTGSTDHILYHINPLTALNITELAHHTVSIAIDPISSGTGNNVGSTGLEATAKSSETQFTHDLPHFPA